MRVLRVEVNLYPERNYLLDPFQVRDVDLDGMHQMLVCFRTSSI
jgi:hypothetical protein